MGMAKVSIVSQTLVWEFAGSLRLQHRDRGHALKVSRLFILMLVAVVVAVLIHHQVRQVAVVAVERPLL
ncbi:hypothetical protein DVP80_00170 [Yersinia enterocolitica]|nr:hypothetical protein [Yersinia enterocolitica]